MKINIRNRDVFGHGSITSDEIPDSTDLEFYKDDKCIGIAVRNGHHLTYYEDKKIHGLPYVIYYFAYNKYPREYYKL